ncbi:MAG: MFS transporter [Chloroflexi bacterium]|nr:MFS transporter [Chloroflexota bacterium]
MSMARLSKRFPALAHVDFRWYWGGLFCYSFAMQARTVIVSWLVYELTGSALSLGWSLATWGLAGVLFSLVGGVFSDRYGARRVVIAFRVLSAAGLLAVALLAATDQLAFWHLLVLSFVNGVVSAFEYPARTALVSGIVPRQELTGGFALTYSAMNLAYIIGPMSMGVVTERAGAEWALLITGLINLLGALLILPVGRGVAQAPTTPVRASFLRDALAGLRHVTQNRALAVVQLTLLIYVVLLMPYRDILAAVAADVLKTGASGLGVLSGAMNAGALLGSVALSLAGEIKRRGKALLAAALFAAVGAAVFGRSEVFALSALLLVIAGIGQGFFIPLDNTLLQTYAAPEMRARVVGVNMFIWSLGPIGTIAIGALADRVGAGLAVTTFAAVSAALFVVAAAAMPRLRRLE